MEALLKSIFKEYGNLGMGMMFLFYMHKQGMVKLTKLTSSVEKLTNNISDLSMKHEKQQMELDYGKKEFEDRKEYETKNDDRVHKLSNTIHEIKNKMVTTDTVQLLIEAAK